MPSREMPPVQLSWAFPEPPNAVDHDAVLGNVLHKLRVAAGLTCEQVGQRSGLGSSRIAGIEEGDGLLPFMDAIPLLAACGSNLVALAHLLERESIRPIEIGGASE